jgi:hypothetical protein
MPGAIGSSVDLIKKAKHNNMFAPSLGRPSLWLLSLGRARESNLLSVIDRREGMPWCNHRHKNSASRSDSNKK